MIVNREELFYEFISKRFPKPDRDLRCQVKRKKHTYGTVY